ncbi:MAG: phosphoglycerate dehydrogenase [Omnitrophica bacterium RIFCSPHIGHO2_02_FULL_46_11]|nr:MAG: phosphoglycerate dehydrogenase [Omnitrophica bacterium RIFCSPLOWO2_01_FULL_45_10b]OGW85785.1 MAG: phosphoglycerate dehydrogenase [Omnitrophica bacterium RIFCSPHIGHO2_02_FULL_46_11]
MKSNFKVLISDPLGERGLEVFKKEPQITVDVRSGLSPQELKKIVADYDAIVVRSGTHLTGEIIKAAARLKVIGRAGVGVDNVDLDAATKQGVIVMNTPEGNTISTSEHTMSLLMALARNIPQAHASVRAGEWKRAHFVGAELNGKTLGIVGFGRIGREVAVRANAFGMRVLAYDPFIAKENLRQLGVEFSDFELLLKTSDFITLHVPLTDTTKNIINEKAIQMMKQGVFLINCARGGLIDEKVLYDALKSGHVRGAALDVFEKEPPDKNPLLSLNQVVVTPHLGAATQEAQENVGISVAHQVVDALLERGIRNAVNLPSVDFETMKVLKPWLILAERLGSMQAQLFGGGFREVSIRYGGEVANFNLAPLTIAVIKGLLTPICGETVNYVNAPAIAKERGITVSESKTTQAEDFTTFITVEVMMDHQKNLMMGTLFGNQDPRIVRINEFFLEVIPKGDVLVIHNEDKPGVVGGVGTILGKNKVNIAEMTLGRVVKGAKTFAMTVINTDEAVPAHVLKELKAFSPIIDAKVIKF